MAILKYTYLTLGKDFLQSSDCFDTIITNPPYSIAFEFIQHAKKLCKEFYFLLPLSYLHGKQRYDDIWMDKDFPLSRIFIFTRYPMLGQELRNDGMYETGMMVYAWYHWNSDHIVGPPTLEWIDNQKYVLKSKE